MSLEEKMRGFVKKVDLPLEVVHVPDPKNSKHGEIKNNSILIYDCNEEDAWESLLHEIACDTTSRIPKPCRDRLPAWQSLSYSVPDILLQSVADRGSGGEGSKG